MTIYETSLLIALLVVSIIALVKSYEAADYRNRLDAAKKSWHDTTVADQKYQETLIRQINTTQETIRGLRDELDESNRRLTWSQQVVQNLIAYSKDPKLTPTDGGVGKFIRSGWEDRVVRRRDIEDHNQFDDHPIVSNNGNILPASSSIVNQA